jgi:hypothetical protein
MKVHIQNCAKDSLVQNTTPPFSISKLLVKAGASTGVLI